MGHADKMIPILSKKLVANEIQGSRHVPAAVDVGMVLSPEVNEETVKAVFLANKPEFFH